MNRIEQKLNVLKENNEKALITYITAGFPNYDKTKEAVKVQEEAGTDVIELGIAFSDPIADGPVIQDASFEAIQGGASLKKSFECMKEMRNEGIRIPIIFMLYYNTVLHYGIEKFVHQCRECGVDGLIIPDLPYEEQDEILALLNGQDETVLIQLVSPASGERIPMILERARGFVYCVSSMGVTGQKNGFHKEIVKYLTRVKEIAKVPVMVGFGIREAKDIEPMKDVVDGAIVGSHLIRLFKESGFDTEKVREYCAEFKRELLK